MHRHRALMRMSEQIRDPRTVANVLRTNKEVQERTQPVLGDVDGSFLVVATDEAQETTQRQDMYSADTTIKS